MRIKRVLSCSVWCCLIQMVVSEMIPCHGRPAEKTNSLPPHHMKMGSRRFVEVHIRQSLSLCILQLSICRLIFIPLPLVNFQTLYVGPCQEDDDFLCVFFCKCKTGRLSEQVFWQRETNLTLGTWRNPQWEMIRITIRTHRPIQVLQKYWSHQHVYFCTSCAVLFVDLWVHLVVYSRGTARKICGIELL